MKKNISTIIVFFLVIFNAQSQSVTGKWKTIDDETGKAKSIVEIYEKADKIYGRIIEVLQEENKKKVCAVCSGDDKNKPVLGMIVIKGLTKDGSEYTDGKILDPTNGKLYGCTISLAGNDKLDVRGYIGFSLLGRTQHWFRIKN